MERAVLYHVLKIVRRIAATSWKGIVLGVSKDTEGQLVMKVSKKFCTRLFYLMVLLYDQENILHNDSIGNRFIRSSSVPLLFVQTAWVCTVWPSCSSQILS